MLDRLHTALTRERDFLADASHELRTPLSQLRTELELALRRPRTPTELTQALRSGLQETEHLCELVEDLLLLARIDNTPPAPTAPLPDPDPFRSSTCSPPSPPATTQP